MPRKQITPEFKSQVILCYNIHGKEYTHKKFNHIISNQTIDNWTDITKQQKYLLQKKKQNDKYKNDDIFRFKQKNQTRNRHSNIRILNPSYSLEEQNREINNIRNHSGKLETRPFWNKTVLSHQPHFYEREKLLLQDPINWNKLNENRIKYLNKSLDQLSERQILLGVRISGMLRGFSHFSPFWFKYFIEKYNPKIIYDPCGGWGHRLLGTLGTSSHYIYNDFDMRTFMGVMNIAKTHNIEATFFNRKAEQFTPPLSYDAVFTCPPYYNVETYNNTEFQDIEDFKNWWISVVNNSSIHTVKYFGVVIDEKYFDHINCFGNLGYQLIENSVVGDIKNVSHFGNGKTQERLYVFGKYL